MLFLSEVKYCSFSFSIKMHIVVCFYGVLFHTVCYVMNCRVMKMSVRVAHIAVAVIICGLIFYSCCLQQELNIVSAASGDSNVACGKVSAGIIQRAKLKVKRQT